MVNYRFGNKETLDKLLEDIKGKWEGICAGYFNGYKIYVQQVKGNVTIYSEAHNGWFETIYKGG